MWHSRLTSITAGLCCAFLISCSSAGLGSRTTLAPEGLDLSGSWILNVEQSDNPQDAADERLPVMVEGGGRRRPMGGRGGRGSAMGGASSRIDPQRIQQTMRMAQAPRRIEVDQRDSTVTIRDGVGRTLMLHTNWKKVSQEIENGGEVDTRARWQGRELQVEREVHLGGKIMQKYSLSPDTDRLHVETSLEMGRSRQPRVFHFVYDPVPDRP